MKSEAKSRIVNFLALLFVFALPTRAAEPPVPPKLLSIEDAGWKLTADAAAGTFSVQSKRDGKVIIPRAKLAGGGGEGKIVLVTHEVFGATNAIEITCPNGNRHQIRFTGFGFILVRDTIHNGTAAPMIVEKVDVLSAEVDLGVAPDKLRAFGTGGLTAVGACPGSYAWGAVVEPVSRRGVVGAWLTHDRASGVVFPKVTDGTVLIDARAEYGRLQIPPGEDANTEMFAIGVFDDARLGLEQWADDVNDVYGISLPPQTTGYCTWYSDKHGKASDEKYLAEIADFAAKNLKPFGFQFVQIDDGWQMGEKLNGPKKNFAAFNPKGAYSSGIKQTADHIKRLGLTPGLWFMPFAGTYNDPVFAEHQDWFTKGADGKPFDTKWGGTSLDMTHPGARDYVKSVVSRIVHEWSFSYLKMDGMFTGTASRLMYINGAYKDDHFGESILHDPDKTHIEAYRDGIKLVREAAGDKVFLLGCCAPQNMRSYAGAFGLVDAMRIGPDNNTGWPALMRGPLFGTRNYFLHNRIWYNDPDPLYVREKLPLDQARLIATWVTISGQLSTSSDWLPDLPPERLDLLKRTMPSHGLLPRPVDLFERDLPRIWLLTDKRHTPRRDVIALYNWDDQPAEIEDTLEHIGLDGGTAYVGFDYWANAPVPPFKGTFKAKLPMRSCRALAVQAVADHPQLVSTSRHITQGIVDVTAETWDAATNTLSGRSRVVGGDPYELRIVTPGAAWAGPIEEVSAVDRAAGVQITSKVDKEWVRLTVNSAISREVSWSVRFIKDK